MARYRSRLFGGTKKHVKQEAEGTAQSITNCPSEISLVMNSPRALAHLSVKKEK